MKKLTVLMISVFLMAAAGQSMARSTKTCIEHNDGKNRSKPVVVTDKNAEDHFSNHPSDECTSNSACDKSGTNVNLTECCTLFPGRSEC